MPPIPSQAVNESATDDRVGIHTKASNSSVGMPHITTSTSLSTLVSRLRRPRRLGAGGRAASVTTVMVTSGSEDRLLLVLDLLQDRGRVVGVLDEVLDGRDHDR